MRKQLNNRLNYVLFQLFWEETSMYFKLLHKLTYSLLISTALLTLKSANAAEKRTAFSTEENRKGHLLRALPSSDTGSLPKNSSNTPTKKKEVSTEQEVKARIKQERKKELDGLNTAIKQLSMYAF